jgi:cytochrome c oxidase subunit 3/cytochrome o ubiquinol oxidase subunit 3
LADTTLAPAEEVPEAEPEHGEGHADDHGDHGHAAHPPTALGVTNEKLGMWLFLGSECLLFGALITTYLLYKDRVPEGAGPAPRDLYDIPFTSVSSFVLLMSSLTMVLAVSAFHRNDFQRGRLWLVATGLLGGLFIAGQVYEFTTFVREGMGYTTNVASSAFYTLTGFHGVHVSIGILILMSLVLLSLRGRLRQGRESETVEICGLYWHFVDVIWILIFTVVYLIP